MAGVPSPSPSLSPLAGGGPDGEGGGAEQGQGAPGGGVRGQTGQGAGVLRAGTGGHAEDPPAHHREPAGLEENRGESSWDV